MFRSSNGVQSTNFYADGGASPTISAYRPMSTTNSVTSWYYGNQRKYKKCFKNEKKNSKRYRILLQLMLLLVQMEEYSLLIIVVSEIITLHLVVIYPIRQRTLNFHDQTACLKSKLIFNIQLVSH